METVYIIGSGPSGVACALGLLENNTTRVVMLDVGRQLEPHFKKRRQSEARPILYPDSSLGQKKPSDYTKHVFGSTYPYATDWLTDHLQLNNAKISASYAKGGLSNIWGASIMPYHPDDFTDWPISATEMQIYYQKMLAHLPLSTQHQQDFQDWPLLHASPQPYPLSKQAEHLWQRYQQHKKTFNPLGLRAGGARLAIYQNQCVNCAECMHGCPQDAIYSTRHTLALLEKNPLFQYQPNIRVEKVTESENSVHIHAVDSVQQTSMNFSTTKVFLATGVFMTARLLMQSLSHLRQTELTLLDSQHFMLPGVMFHRQKNTRHKQSHSLSQLYYELSPANSPDTSIHLQLYTYMDLFEHALKNKLGYLGQLTPLLKPLTERLVVIQGYLPSACSGQMSLQFCQRTEQLIVTGKRHKDTHEKLQQIQRLLRKQARKLGFLPLSLQISDIGAGNHYGGSFPMKKQPQLAQECDTLGRPQGLKNIHIVDASVFPSIAASSITLTIMANAFRIGSQCLS